MSSRWGSTSIPNLLNMLFFLFETWAAAPSTPNPLSVSGNDGKRRWTKVFRGFGYLQIFAASPNSPIAWPCHAQEERHAQWGDAQATWWSSWHRRAKVGASLSYKTKCVGFFRDEDVSWFIYLILFTHFSFFHYPKKSNCCIMLHHCRHIFHSWN